MDSFVYKNNASGYFFNLESNFQKKLASFSPILSGNIPKETNENSLLNFCYSSINLISNPMLDSILKFLLKELSSVYDAAFPHSKNETVLPRALVNGNIT